MINVVLYRAPATRRRAPSLRRPSRVHSFRPTDDRSAGPPRRRRRFRGDQGGEGPIPQDRGAHPDARRRTTLHVDLRATRHHAELPVPHESHAIRNRRAQSRRISRLARPWPRVHEGGNDLRPAGCARTLLLRGRLHGDDAAQRREREQQGCRRIHRFVRHHRLAREEHPA